MGPPRRPSAMRMLTCAALFSLAALAQQPESKPVTWTGWFGDAGCSRGRASGGAITPPNPVCAEQCIAKGTAAVFISEQAREVFVVKDDHGVLGKLGYRLEV